MLLLRTPCKLNCEDTIVKLRKSVAYRVPTLQLILSPNSELFVPANSSELDQYSPKQSCLFVKTNDKIQFPLTNTHLSTLMTDFLHDLSMAAISEAHLLP